MSGSLFETWGSWKQTNAIFHGTLMNLATRPLIKQYRVPCLLRQMECEFLEC